MSGLGFIPMPGGSGSYVALAGGTTANPQRVTGVLKFNSADGTTPTTTVLDTDSPAGPFMGLNFNNDPTNSPEGIHLVTGANFAGGAGGGQNLMAFGNNYGGVALFINNYLTGVGLKITNRSSITGTTAWGFLLSQNSSNSEGMYLSQDTNTAKMLVKMVSATIGSVGGAGAATNQQLASAYRSQAATADTLLWALCVDTWDVRVPVTITGFPFTADSVAAKATGAFVEFYDTGGTANSRRFRLSQSSGSYLVTARNDDGTNKATLLQIDQSGNHTYPNAANIIVGTTTGTKIGTATTQKLAFFNATPVVQPSGTPVASTDLATVIALANSLRTNLLALGLVA